MARNVKFEDLEKFKDKVKESLDSDAVDAFIQSCAKELAARLLAKVIKRTPVGKKPFGKDVKKTVKIKTSKGNRSYLTREGAILEQYWSGYQGGTLRRGWTGGKSMSAHVYAQSLKVNHFADTYVVEVVNPIEYASYVEFGHRQKPGRYVPQIGKKLTDGWVERKFMLTISEQEIQSGARSILENKLKKKLGECFK